MKPLGRKQTKTQVEGHQHCSTCHPQTKAHRAHEKITAQHVEWIADPWKDERLLTSLEKNIEKLVSEPYGFEDEGYLP